MKRIVKLAALLTIAGLGALAAAANGSDKKASQATILRLDGEVTLEQFVDNPPAGESVGDLGVFTETLSRAGRRAGEMSGSCVLIEPPAGFQCTAIVELRGGSLVLAANVTEGSRAVGAITGGTGRYRRARGSFTVEPVAENQERLTIRVLR